MSTRPSQERLAEIRALAEKERRNGTSSGYGPAFVLMLLAEIDALGRELSQWRLYRTQLREHLIEGHACGQYGSEACDRILADTAPPESA